MPVLEEIPITLTAEQVLASPRQRETRPELLDSANEAIALGQTLWAPIALYDWYDVKGTEGEWVHLASSGRGDTGAALRIGTKADLLSGAEQVLVSVCTIGPALERQVHELQATGEGLKSFLLDSAGVVALGAVGEAVRCLAEDTAAERGWGVSPSLSPGSLIGWPVRGQRQLCGLLPLERIGVRLNDHCVLEPHKSVSGLIGLGPGYDTTRVGSVCKYCALQGTCWRRRRDPS
jgi:hypothetical protein